MSGKNKDQQEILSKLGITELNQMQVQAQTAIETNDEVVLLSPTGTGKTLAFLLPIIARLDNTIDQVQVLILVPTRELAIQIEQVIREMGSGFKATAVYGGKSGNKDKIQFKNPPAILIGTPGRIADHMRRQNIITDSIKTLVLDEFDKSLEIGFEVEMKEIIYTLRSVEKKILTSATQRIEIPEFVGLKNPEYIKYEGSENAQLTLRTIASPTKDKLATLVNLIGHIEKGNGIIFCNFKDTIQIVSDYLSEKKISHGCFFGGLEQIDRERALIKFRNGTNRFLVATDLAARGLDVPEMDFIIHFELPSKKVEFIHRNGRTARMNSNGVAYILKWEGESLPGFIEGSEVERIQLNQSPVQSEWETLFISGGRKDKISKGDIAGLFLKQGNLKKDELGSIELKQDCAFVAVPIGKTQTLIAQLNNSQLKNKKVRITLLA